MGEHSLTKNILPLFFQAMKSKSVSNHKQKQRCGVTRLHAFAEIEVTLSIFVFGGSSTDTHCDFGYPP